MDDQEDSLEGVLQEEPVEEDFQASEKQRRILRNLKDTELELKIVMAEQKYPIEELIALSPGSILVFEAKVDDYIHLSINNKKFAFGEVVQIGERFGFQIEKLNE